MAFLPGPSIGASPDRVALQRYIDATAPFTLRASGARIRVAATLLTCEVAVAILNNLRVQGESGASYRYVNVHNPRCPIGFDAAVSMWVFRPLFARHPVWGVNWAGAVLMCDYLGARLPTSAEWAAFASNNDLSRRYPWGDEPPNPMLANYSEYYGGTTEVGRFPPNELGLYDLAGNLGEWCQDGYAVAPGGRVYERVVKGGAWSKDECHLQNAAVRGKWARLGTTTIGFRPVWDD